MKRLGSWELIRRLSTGHVAEVFLVRDADQEDGEIRVLKRLLPIHVEEADLIEAFTREATLAPELNHPGLVGIHTHGFDEGVPYLVLDYVDGCSLDELVKFNTEPMSPALARVLMCDVLEALAHLHGLSDDHGNPLVVAHRDVTPNNVLINREGHAILIDYGLVKGAVAQRETATNVVKGTWRYASPEQLRGRNVDATTDVYGVGAMMFFLVTGTKPFSHVQELDDMMEAKLSVPLRLEGHTEDLTKVILETTAVNPADRPQDADGFRRRLEAIAEPEEDRDAIRAEIMELVSAVVESRDPNKGTLTVKPSAEELGEEVTDPAAVTDITRVATVDEMPEADPETRSLAIIALILLGLFGWLILF
ncbi:MAG: hypothetical protein CMH54_04915 [Myxococcales bacterium]|nr:hypothetical protein [Myxococcales bacterium]|tara:strand:+ start:802 stop:1893 length:1092 start_codon:yes stop_codon:yes gene_type:complete